MWQKIKGGTATKIQFSLAETNGDAYLIERIVFILCGFVLLWYTFF